MGGRIGRFNSLQTGKGMESRNLRAVLMQAQQVSIPFKRERAWKVNPLSQTQIPHVKVSIPFKRERAWKDGSFEANRSQHRKVSIPFKRERAWKVAGINLLGCPIREVSIPFKRERAWKEKQCPNGRKNKKFQFPSNGKGHGKCIKVYEVMRHCRVSFNSLQTGKGMESLLKPLNKRGASNGFNSLQTGKGMESILGN